MMFALEIFLDGYWTQSQLINKGTTKMSFNTTAGMKTDGKYALSNPNNDWTKPIKQGSQDISFDTSFMATVESKLLHNLIFGIESLSQFYLMSFSGKDEKYLMPFGVINY